MSGTLRTAGLFILLMMLFSAVGWAIGGYFLQDWVLGAVLFLTLAAVMNLVSYFMSDRIVLWSYKARLLEEKEAPNLFRLVRRVATFSDLPMPKVALIPSMTPNAFATGRNPNKAVVAVTRGILNTLSDEELEGVIAHEMAHIKDRDILVMSVAATLAGAIAFMSRFFWWSALFGRRSQGNIIVLLLIAITAPIAALLVQLAISRSREYKADSVGARTIGRPLALAKALEKLDRANRRRPIEMGNPASSSLFIVNPFRRSVLTRLFSTHPPVEARVKRLKEMARELGRY
ncbi:MAG: zinc metalloprotease HtpX [Thermoplasmata archaeon]